LCALANAVYLIKCWENVLSRIAAILEAPSLNARILRNVK